MRFPILTEAITYWPQVNEINLDPKKALELAKPGTLPSYTDSHVYSARLPVCRPSLPCI